jgi:GntR family transcriptional regulator/MocR family aminotransferase
VGAFIPGVPDVNAFPHPLFSKIQARISRRPKPEQLSYSCNGGTAGAAAGVGGLSA